MEEHETDFQSLTDAKINEELKEKKEKDAADPNKVKIQEVGGIKFAPLEPSN